MARGGSGDRREPAAWLHTDFVPPDPTDTTIVDEAVALVLTRYRTGS